MLKESVQPKGPILNILQSQCERKNKMELFTSRFGEPKFTTLRKYEREK
jgi:hypothetical protein